MKGLKACCSPSAHWWIQGIIGWDGGRGLLVAGGQRTSPDQPRRPTMLQSQDAAPSQDPPPTQQPTYSSLFSQQNLFGYSTIYSLRLRDSRDSRDSQDSETPETPRLPRLRDSRGFCHITFQFSFISDLPLFQIFQILQILKWKWKWKDPTFAIFLKNMGFKDVEYNIPETLRLWDSETKRGQNHKM